MFKVLIIERMNVSIVEIVMKTIIAVIKMAYKVTNMKKEEISTSVKIAGKDTLLKVTSTTRIENLKLTT